MALRRTFADQPVNTSRLPAFRAEHFPYSGPFPWLDHDDAAEQIEARLSRKEITPEDAELCRCWAANGYVILNNLIQHEILDDLWAAYEKAIQRGKIELPSESA